MKQTNANSLISLAAMLLILALSAGMDHGILYLRELNGRTASYIQLTLVSYSAAHLLLAVLLLALFFWMVLSAYTSKCAAWIYLLVGLGISLYPAVYFTPVAEWIQLPLVNIISARSFLITAGSSIAVTGAAAFLRNRLQRIVQESQGATDCHRDILLNQCRYGDYLYCSSPSYSFPPVHSFRQCQSTLSKLRGWYLILLRRTNHLPQSPHTWCWTASLASTAM